MSSKQFRPPGQHPLDQACGKLPPADYHLERLSTYMRWNLEHYSSFLHDRETNPDNADRELGHLGDSVERGHEHLVRLLELIAAGFLPSRSDEDSR